MAKRKVFENEIFEGKNWSNYTSKNHLLAAYGGDPTYISDRVEKILDYNIGENFVSMVMKHGIYKIPANKDEFQWTLKNDHVRNYELIGAFEDRAMNRQIGTATQTPGYRAGANRTEFYMLFEGNPFGPGEIIVGHLPDVYRIIVTDRGENISGDKWLYKVQLNSADQNFFVPTDQLVEGLRWSSDGGVTTDELSDKGYGIEFESDSALASRLSMFRMEHTIPGNLVNYKPMGFYVKGKNGKAQELWMSNVEYEFLKKARLSTASKIMYDQSNVSDDGSIANKDSNGNPMTTGAGFKQQWSISNKYTYNGLPDFDELREMALDTVAGKYDFSNREMVIKGGEWGLVALSDMVANKYGASAIQFPQWIDDGTGRAFDWMDNDVKVKTGQVYAVALVNGIKFKFVLDPSKDDVRRNKEISPYGGPWSSYEYDIMGFGGKDENSNMQIVRREGEAPIWAVEEGIRGFYSGGKSFKGPKQVSSAVDGSTIHYFEPGVGAIVWDPTKIVRYYPEATQG